MYSIGSGLQYSVGSSYIAVPCYILTMSHPARNLSRPDPTARKDKQVGDAGKLARTVPRELGSALLVVSSNGAFKANALDNRPTYHLFCARRSTFVSPHVSPHTMTLSAPVKFDDHEWSVRRRPHRVMPSCRELQDSRGILRDTFKTLSPGLNTARF